jgi:hypothetical protein
MEEYTHVEDRLDGDVYGGLGDEYAAFVQDTVRPLVDDVWGEPATVGTMGSSLGGRRPLPGRLRLRGEPVRHHGLGQHRGEQRDDDPALRGGRPS